MKRRSRKRAGATAVEFALVAPIFFLMVFALLEFSRLNVIRHTADNAAYEASRRAIVPGASADDAVAEANRIMRIVGARSVQVDVDPSEITNATEQVTVTVTTPMAANALIAPRFSGSAVIRANSTLRTERVRTR